MPMELPSRASFDKLKVRCFLGGLPLGQCLLQ
jgi:hypothetical protein